MLEYMYYHYIFRTYKSKSSLINKEFKDFLCDAFKSIAIDKGFQILASSILEDHVHLLVQQPVSDSTNYVMRMLKGISSRRFFKSYPSNRLEHRKLWGRSYYAKMVADQDIPKIILYIKNQTDAHGTDKRYNRRGLLVGSSSTERS